MGVSRLVIIGGGAAADLWGGTMETEITASEIANVQNQIVRSVMAIRLFRPSQITGGARG